MLLLVVAVGSVTLVTEYDQMVMLAMISPIRAVLIRAGKMKILVKLRDGVDENGKTAKRRRRSVKSTTHVLRDCTRGKAKYVSRGTPPSGLNKTPSYTCDDDQRMLATDST